MKPDCELCEVSSTDTAWWCLEHGAGNKPCTCIPGALIPTGEWLASYTRDPKCLIHGVGGSFTNVGGMK